MDVRYFGARVADAGDEDQGQERHGAVFVEECASAAGAEADASEESPDVVETPVGVGVGDALRVARHAHVGTDVRAARVGDA